MKRLPHQRSTATAVTLALTAFSSACRRDTRVDGLTPMARAAPRDGGAPRYTDVELRARVPGGAALDEVLRVALLAPMDVVVIRARRGRAWESWAVDAQGAQTGLSGAARVLRGWSAMSYEPFTEDLARVVGLFALPDARVFTAREVVETDGGPRWASPASLSPRDASGARVLSFSYRDAQGALRVASYRLEAAGAVRAMPLGRASEGRR